jgi:DNA polymerase-3 subunit gamma/tau
MQLSQKYRQYKLSSIVGQDTTVKDLARHIEEVNIPKVIYLPGDSGCGKTTLARIIAMRINCENPQGIDSCCECPSCKSVMDETWFFDIKESNASNINIEFMRDLDNDSTMGSFYQGSKKVRIINECQELKNNQKALKNMLDLMERKDDNFHLIITAMNDDFFTDDKTRVAFRRRSLTYRLKNLSPEDIGSFLLSVCEKESVKVDEEKINVIVTIAQNSGGSIGDALAYFERVIYSDLWDADKVITELGITSQDTLLRMVGDILSGKPEALSSYPPKESLEKVKWMLLNCIKAKLSIVDEYERKQIGKLPDLFPVERFKFVLDGLMALYGMPYIDSFAIQSWVLNCVMSVERKQLTARDLLSGTTKDRPVRGRGR